jgi:molybdopterin converting factor small subunit
MSATISISPLLRRYLDIPASVQVSGKTVGQSLEDLFIQYPEARQWVSDRNVMMQILIDLNGQESLDRPLKDGDHLNLIGLIVGG